MEPNALLRGGPADELADRETICQVSDTAAAVKLLRGNRYAHYEPTTEFVTRDDHRLRVFLWSRFTYIAE